VSTQKRIDGAKVWITSSTFDIFSHALSHTHYAIVETHEKAPYYMHSTYKAKTCIYCWQLFKVVNINTKSGFNAYTYMKGINAYHIWLGLLSPY